MDEQIYLDPNAPPEPPPRRPGNPRQRITLVAVLVLVIGLVIVVQHTRHPARPPAAAAPTPTPTPSVTTLAPWPQGRGVCGSELELPLFTSDPLSISTSATVLLTGTDPGRLDVDLGSVDRIPGLALRSDQYASQLVAAGSSVYAMVRSCANRTTGTAVRTYPDGRSQRVAGGLYELLAGGNGVVWGERYLARAEAALGTTLVRLDRTAPAVELPLNLHPIGLAGDNLLATRDPLPATPAESPLYVYDLRTHRQRLIGNSCSVSVSDGVALWNATPCSATGPCTLHSFDLRSSQQTVRQFHLPLESTFDDAVLSPDHRKLIYLLPRESPDATYRSANPQTNPADLVLLDLDTGVVNPVTGLELPPGSRPTQLSFTSDGSALLISLAVNGGTTELVWQTQGDKLMLSRAG